MSSTPRIERAPGPVATWFGLLPGALAGLVVTALAGGERTFGSAALVAVSFAALSWLAADARKRVEADDDRYVLWVVGLSTAVALALIGLSIFAAALKANTHHKSLAGVTYAIVALGVLGAASVAGARLGGTAMRWASTSPIRRRAVLAFALLVVLNVAILVLRRGELLQLSRLAAAGAFAAFAGGFFLRGPSRRVAPGPAQP